MSNKILISSVIFGGAGTDNPVPLTMDNYHLTSEEQQFSYINMNIISPFTTGGTRDVTALIRLDPRTGDPLVGPNNYAWRPCPPYC
ncbi:MAG TPA: hypothetical protein VFG10_10345 [Saprospiraceae bacterium]|nr:hypothetical protein [Saprospiraceae bacterium]